jgi:hypothetical protein
MHAVLQKVIKNTIKNPIVLSSSYNIVYGLEAQAAENNGATYRICFL